MQLKESVNLAIGVMRGSKLRTALTLLGIAIGVFSIIGVMTFIGMLQNSVRGSLAQLGANTFSIQKMPALPTGDQATWRKYNARKDITYRQVRTLEEQLGGDLAISPESSAGGAVIKYGGKETNPNINIIGCGTAYVNNKGFAVAEGRFITADDVDFSRDVVVIGADIPEMVFGNENPIGRSIKVNNRQFEVVGILARKGSVFGQSQDNFVALPISTFLHNFKDEWDTSVNMTIQAPSVETMGETMDIAEAALRAIRKVRPGEQSDFEVVTNDGLISQFNDFTRNISLGAAFIASIALLAAGIGIMNIMLVSVTERTREIGIRKAVGATKKNILTQFLTESVVLSEFGGVIGILLGIALANVIAMYMKLDPYVPYDWVIISLVICSAIGICFGVYPAWRASKLDPIEALRYE